MEGARVEVYKTVGDVKLNMYIFEPAGRKPADERPAIVFFFGTNDRLLAGARYLQKRMKAEGNRCELLTWDGLPHGFFNYGRYAGKPFLETMRAADKFLASLGYLEGEPTIEEYRP
jgi:acetyl esterase/lipase